MKTRPSRRVPRATLAIVLVPAVLAACDTTDRINGFRVQPPPSIEATYQWVDLGWFSRTQPDGYPAVRLTWELPENFAGESFNVYSASAGDSRYILSATVTSCSNGVCEYLDRDVEPGQVYDYYVATLDERTGEEAASGAVEVAVPNGSAPPQPPAPEAVALDGAVFLHWPEQGARRYRVFLEGIDGDSVFFDIGATDGLGYVDSRAENGHSYAYAIASVDTLGRPGARSPLAVAIPRPDYHADLLYPLDLNADSSGFRFRASESESPIVPGNSVSA
ncbi:MAG TPA: hypothetical protein VFI96_07290, partial [Longimicrobiaceae bacterium]|nr:hypothetical protein [Longimicrobiaceae bacterium]